MRLASWKGIAIAASLTATVATGAAHAQDNVCVDLEARLVQLERGNGGGSDPRQFDGPIAQQRSEIDRATAEARRSGCMGGFFIFQKTPAPKCGQLMATINQMQGNLQKLMSQRAEAGGDPFSLAQQRSDVLRALAQNRCGSTLASTNDEFAMPREGLFASLFGGRLRTFDDMGPFSPDTNFGTYRTLCVRTCDGFYFPISFSTVPSQFADDEQTCQAMCPGTEVNLYTYRNPGEDAEQMVSLSGEPYTSLPTAFQFRTKYDKSCTCHSATATADGFADFSQVQTPDAIAPMPPTGTVTPMPRLRPAAGEDPETIANRAGGFVPGPVTPPAASESATTASADGQKQIRIVGPTSYYGE